MLAEKKKSTILSSGYEDGRCVHNHRSGGVALVEEKPIERTLRGEAYVVELRCEGVKPVWELLETLVLLDLDGDTIAQS